ncbi:MAG: response regulator [Reyranella sp.]|nr:response regulator [Reyranella sp.]
MVTLDFSDRNVLIVEDDVFLALDLERVLDDAGCSVIGPAPSVERALARIDDTRLDAALLDVNLGHELVFPVADRLCAEDVPFIFVTGDPSKVPERHWTRPIVTKPFLEPALLEALAAVMRPH